MAKQTVSNLIIYKVCLTCKYTFGGCSEKQKCPVCDGELIETASAPDLLVLIKRAIGLFDQYGVVNGEFHELMSDMITERNKLRE